MPSGLKAAPCRAAAATDAAAASERERAQLVRAADGLEDELR
jgi:hypothetical protein